TPSPKLSDVSPDILLAKTIYYNSQNATLTSQETVYANSIKNPEEVKKGYAATQNVRTTG
ncbi:hypothetical protein NQ318_020780, partial [Aromia moschata]